LKDECLQINAINKNALNTNQLRSSRFVCSNSTSAIPHLEFSLVIQSNNLTYQGNTYIEHQQFLYLLIKSLHNKGYGYRRISYKLNDWGVKTPRGKKWFNTSVSSILKRKHERDIRIEQVRNKEYPIKIGKFSVKYYTF
jgi:hypothetical protein